eukprot:ctg_3161.g413
MSMTVCAFPASAAVRAKYGLPLAAVVRPLAPPPPPSLLGDQTDEAVPVVNFGAAGVIRCRRCRTYINFAVIITDGGRRWRCNVTAGAVLRLGGVCGAQRVHGAATAAASVRVRAGRVVRGSGVGRTGHRRGERPRLPECAAARRPHPRRGVDVQHPGDLLRAAGGRGRRAAHRGGARRGRRVPAIARGCVGEFGRCAPGRGEAAGQAVAVASTGVVVVVVVVRSQCGGGGDARRCAGQRDRRRVLPDAALGRQDGGSGGVAAHHGYGQAARPRRRARVLHRARMSLAAARGRAVQAARRRFHSRASERRPVLDAAGGGVCGCGQPELVGQVHRRRVFAFVRFRCVTRRSATATSAGAQPQPRDRLRGGIPVARQQWRPLCPLPRPLLHPQHRSVGAAQRGCRQDLRGGDGLRRVPGAGQALVCTERAAVHHFGRRAAHSGAHGGVADHQLAARLVPQRRCERHGERVGAPADRALRAPQAGVGATGGGGPGGGHAGQVSAAAG